MQRLCRERSTTTTLYDANNCLPQDIKTPPAGFAGTPLAGEGGEEQTVTTGRYIYDANGNQLAKVSETLSPATGAAAQVNIDASDVELYDYDGFNRMVRSNVNGVETDYTYRADGLRNSKETSAGKTTHLWDGANIAADMNGSSVVARYVRGINLLMSETAGTQKYYLYNGHGDVVQLAGSNGAILWRYDYDAFGNEREVAGQDAALDANPFRYCGEYFDKETGTIYLRARYYSPLLGRFRAEDSHWNPGNMIYGDNPLKWNEHEADANDPLGLNNYTYKPDVYAIMQSGNLYAYCVNNPLMYYDPTGEWVAGIGFSVIAGFAGGFVAAASYVFDGYGNEGILIILCGGAVWPQLSGSISLMYSWRDSIYDMEMFNALFGGSYQVGIGIQISIGFDILADGLGFSGLQFNVCIMGLNPSPSRRNL